MFVIFLKTKTTFTTVTGNELTVVVKLINSKNTVVVTSLTAAHGSSVFKMDDLINREHLCITRFIFSLSCD